MYCDLRANYCKKDCIDFIIDHIEFLQQLSNTVHQMISVSHKLVYTYDNVECTEMMKLQGFRPFDIFPSRLDMTPVPLVSNGFFYCTPRV